jgi:hypothetical protein
MLKGLVVFTVSEVHRRRQPDVARGHALELRGVPHADQRVRLRICQRPEQDAVDDAEDRRGCADAEGQRSNGGKREGGVPADQAAREAEIFRQKLEPSDTVHLIDLFANQERVPELPPCGRVCRLRRQAGADVPVDQQVEMHLELMAGFIVNALA